MLVWWCRSPGVVVVVGGGGVVVAWWCGIAVVFRVPCRGADADMRISNLETKGQESKEKAQKNIEGRDVGTRKE